jgi:hypothetical protein
LIESDGGKREMVRFQVEVLGVKNHEGKNIFVNAELFDIKASYAQEPLTRCGNYLLKQVLPSLIGLFEMPKRNVKPELPCIQFQVSVENVKAVIEARCNADEYFQMSVAKIEI